MDRDPLGALSGRRTLARKHRSYWKIAIRRRSATGCGSTVQSRTVRRKHCRAEASIDEEALAGPVGEGLTIAQIAARIGRSSAGVRYWLKKYGLTDDEPAWTEADRAAEPRREARQRAIGASRRTVQTHGPTEFVIQGSGQVVCRKCRMASVSAAPARKNKEELATEAGGKCVRCGYDTLPRRPAVPPSRSR